MNELANVNADSGTTRIEYKEKPVLTTEQLAEFYDCNKQQIQQNFNNNQKYFIEGKHFFKLEGESFEEFKNLHFENFELQISPMARSLYLWTKQGVARHSKMLNTERAWAVYEVLEETYFNAPKLSKTEEIARILKYATPAQRERIVAATVNEILGEEVLPIMPEKPGKITPKEFMKSWLADEKNADFIIFKNGKPCILPHSELVADALKAGFTRRELLKPLAKDGSIDISFEVTRGKRHKRFTVAVRVNGKKMNVIRILF